MPGFTRLEGDTFSDHVGKGQWRWDGAWNGQKAQTTSAGKLQVLRRGGSQAAVTCSRA